MLFDKFPDFGFQIIWFVISTFIPIFFIDISFVFPPPPRYWIIAPADLIDLMLALEILPPESHSTYEFILGRVRAEVG